MDYNLALLARTHCTRLTRGARATSLIHLDSNTDKPLINGANHTFMLYLFRLFHSKKYYSAYLLINGISRSCPNAQADKRKIGGY